MLLRFTKMHGIGNDFVVLDLISQRFNLQEQHVRMLPTGALVSAVIRCWW